MDLVAHQLVIAILWFAPVVQIFATLVLAAGAYCFRGNLGADNLRMATLVPIAVGALMLHGGYFLGPVWWYSGRHLLAAATMLPVALAVVGTMIILFTQTRLMPMLARSGVGARLAACGAAGVLFLAYLGPLLLMLAAST